MIPVVPRSLEPWNQEPEYRVEYWRSDIAHRCVVYFDNVASAREFAAEHTFWNQRCFVQSKSMPATHKVEKYSFDDDAYVFWSRSFGDLETARDVFERHAVATGAYRLIEIGRATPIAVSVKMEKSHG